MLSSDEQYSNAARPILFTLSGMVMLSSDEQPENAESAIVFVPSFMLYSPETVFFASIKLLPIYRTPSRQFSALL